MSPTESDQERSRGTVQAVENCIKIIKSMEESGGLCGVTELATTTGISKSSVHKHLSTLAKHNFVVKDDDRYHLGYYFLNIGSFVREQHPSASLIKQKMREVALETGEVAFFTIEENGRGVILFREVGTEGVPTRSRVGMQLPLHQIAAGKAILSEYSEQDVQRIIEMHGLPAATPQSITDSDALLNELEQTKERGYSISDDEATEGLRAIGVPVSLPAGEVVGSCAVAGPTHRMKGETIETIVELLQSISNEVELNIAHSR